MKKSPIHRLLVILAAVCIAFAVVCCLRAVNLLSDVQDHMDRSQLAMMKDEEQMDNILKKREQKSKKKRSKALDKKREKEASETPSPTPEETALPEETETAEDSENSFADVPNGHTVGIDPGHQGFWVDMSDVEPNAPGSSEMKVRCTTGTTGKYTGLEEFQLNLDVSLKLREILQSRGYQVVMTREDNDANISNAERAQKVAREGAEIYVRIHANSSEDSSVSGALTMCPSAENPYVSSLYDESYRLSETILNSYCQATGIGSLGVTPTDTMTGINWSSVPVTIVEMGFMSNQGDDTAMADSSFQQRMAEGIADGIDSYFGIE